MTDRIVNRDLLSLIGAEHSELTQPHAFSAMERGSSLTSPLRSSTPAVAENPRGGVEILTRTAPHRLPVRDAALFAALGLLAH